MKTMSVTAQMNSTAGSGYKCSKCGAKFYTYTVKNGWYKYKVTASDQIWLHINTGRCTGAKKKWCW